MGSILHGQPEMQSEWVASSTKDALNDTKSET